MVNLKFYNLNKNCTDTLVNTGQIFSKDIGKEFEIRVQ